MNWEPPGFAHGRVAGGSEREARLRDFRRQRRRNPTLDAVRVGGGAHQEGGRKGEDLLSLSLLSSPLVSSFDHFPAAAAAAAVVATASCSNAQTTRTTPSGGQAGGPTSVHLDFHLPLSRPRPPPKPPGFPAKTHTLHSSPLFSSISKHATERLDRERERGRSLSVR